MSHLRPPTLTQSEQKAILTATAGRGGPEDGCQHMVYSPRRMRRGKRNTNRGWGRLLLSSNEKKRYTRLGRAWCQ